MKSLIGRQLCNRKSIYRFESMHHSPFQDQVYNQLTHVCLKLFVHSSVADLWFLVPWARFPDCALSRVTDRRTPVIFAIPHPSLVPPPLVPWAAAPVAYPSIRHLRSYICYSDMCGCVNVVSWERQHINASWFSDRCDTGIERFPYHFVFQLSISVFISAFIFQA